MLGPLVRKFSDWQQRRLAISHLRHLDDRLLADVGTHRDDIVDFVNRAPCN